MEAVDNLELNTLPSHTTQSFSPGMEVLADALNWAAPHDINTSRRELKTTCLEKRRQLWLLRTSEKEICCIDFGWYEAVSYRLWIVCWL